MCCDHLSTLQDGPVANIKALVQEFVATLRLQPLRVAVVGGPKAGKTSLAKELATTYGLPTVTAESAVEAARSGVRILVLCFGL